MTAPASGTMEFPHRGAAMKVAAPVLSSLLYLSMFYVPIVGSLLNPFAPLPLVYNYFRYGQVSAILAVGISSALIGAAAGVPAGVFFALSYGLLALVMARGIERQMEISAVVASASAVAFGATAIFLWFALPGTAAEIYELSLKMVNQFLSEAVETYKKAGIPAEQVEFITQNADSISRWVIRLIPGTAAMGYLLMAAMNYVAYRGMQLRWTFLKPAGPADLGLWSPPDKMVFAFIAGLGLALVPDEAARAAGINVLIPVMAVYFIGGFCVIRFWFEKVRVPKFLRMAVYLLVLLHPFVIVGVAGTGLFDLWFDFRKIRRKDGMKEENNGTDT
ncbi:MAG: DUF2232 domain-containing protein [Nitrospinae bacterium]|nr:DUF2232 domain-containing protein [Nitrospinota bacterium]